MAKRVVRGVERRGAAGAGSGLIHLHVYFNIRGDIFNIKNKTYTESLDGLYEGRVQIKLRSNIYTSYLFIFLSLVKDKNLNNKKKEFGSYILNMSVFEYSACVVGHLNSLFYIQLAMYK